MTYYYECQQDYQALYSTIPARRSFGTRFKVPCY
ncbi:hypothetical protein KL928_001978, partial [Ogataea angusta]